MTREELVKHIDKEALKVIDMLEKKHKNHNFDWQILSTGNLIAHCPLKNNHKNGDKNKSFSIYRDETGHWHWHCFGCNYNGPSPKDIDEIEADIEILKEDLKRQLKKESKLPAFTYLSSRIDKYYLLDEQTQELLFTFDVGYYFYDTKFITEFSRKFKESVSVSPVLWERNNYEWLVFPYRNISNGSISTLKFRNITVPKKSENWLKTIKIEDKKNKKENKKISSSSISIFGYKNLFLQAPIIFITEGEFDAITLTLSTNALYPAVALGSVSNFTVEKIKKIAEFTKDKAIIVLLDWDIYGQEKLEQLIDNFDYKFLRKHKLFTIPHAPANVKDIDEYLHENYDTALEKVETLLENAVSFIDLKKQREEQKKKEQEEKIISLYPQNILQKFNIITQKQRQRFSIKQILSVDFGDIINTFDVFYEGVNLLVSRGGIGKSFIMLLATIDYAFKNKNKVLFISFEDFLNKKFKEDRIENAIEYYAKSVNISENEVKEVVNDLIDIDFSYENVFDKDARGKLKKTEYFDLFKEDLKKYNFVIIDPLLSFVGVDELDSSLIRKALLKIRQLLINEEKQKIIVFTHHTNKNLKVFSELSNKSKLTFEDYNSLIEMVRGTMETTNVIRNVVFALGYPTAKNVKRLVIIKSNITEIGKIKKVITPWPLANEYESLQCNTKDNTNNANSGNLNLTGRVKQFKPTTRI